MRIRISHATSYHYESPPKSVTQVLRLTPRNDDGQFVVNWRVEVSQDCQLHQHEDAFGNVSHVFSAEGPFDELSVTVAGQVDTHDTHGIVSGAIERFPPGLYLRETALTTPDAAIIDFAEATRAKAGDDTLTLLHALMMGVNAEMTFDVEPTQPSLST
jgi:transglutaminase-like putative cysteine protease